MNVTHICQVNIGGGRHHGTRFQLPPGNPFNVHCPDHPDATLVQTEFFAGIDSFHVDADGRPTSVESHGHLPVQGQVQDPGFTPVKQGPQGAYEDPPAPTATVPEEEQRAALAAEWRGLTNSEPDGRWGLPRLRAEVELATAAAKIARDEAAAKARANEALNRE